MKQRKTVVETPRKVAMSHGATPHPSDFFGHTHNLRIEQMARRDAR
jgi:hypothetical protein